MCFFLKNVTTYVSRSKGFISGDYEISLLLFVYGGGGWERGNFDKEKSILKRTNSVRNCKGGIQEKEETIVVFILVLSPPFTNKNTCVETSIVFPFLVLVGDD